MHLFIASITHLGVKRFTIPAIHGEKKRKALRRTMRVVEGGNKKEMSIKKPKAGKTAIIAVKRSGESLEKEENEENEAKKAKIDASAVDEAKKGGVSLECVI
ncbi:hypothetical protein G6011_06642 [Alternaria panax]|uniref:Uncharacterized protein n=1 Tax=Alternaria panax TaxID=48097 RepID=A0AAD4FFU1_9PLEO|nr:hypothetical protein G6011_06642 [Alternaria panax]